MDKYALFYQVALEKLQGQEELHREFGTKASNMLALGAAMIGVGAVVLSLSGENPTLGAAQTWVFVPFLLAFIFAGLFSISVLWPRNWQHSPEITALAAHFDDYADNALLEWVGHEYARSVGLNQRVLDAKAKLIRWSMTGLAVEAVMLAILGFVCCWQP